MNKRELLLERAKKAQLPNGPGYVTFQDFVNVVSASKSKFLVPHEALTHTDSHRFDVAGFECKHSCMWQLHMFMLE